MMNHRNKILLAALLVQLVIIFFVYRADQPPATPELAFFPALAADEIETMTITDENGGMIRLARDELGWLIAATHTVATVQSSDAPILLEPPLPADGAKVQVFARHLAEFKPTRLVTRTRASQSRLKVSEEQFVRRIELTKRGGRTVTLFLGSSPSFKAIHARIGGESEVYLAEGITAWETDTELSSWWRNDYMDLEPSELQEVSLVNANGSIKMRRDGEKGWQLAGAAEGEKIVGELLEEFLYRIGYIPLFDYLAREGRGNTPYGLEPPEARLTLDTGNEKIEIMIGPEEEESGLRVVKSSASPFYVRVASPRLSTILNQKRTDLLFREQGGGADRLQPAEG
jgi:hypothetical protein